MVDDITPEELRDRASPEHIGQLMEYVNQYSSDELDALFDCDGWKDALGLVRKIALEVVMIRNSTEPPGEQGIESAAVSVLAVGMLLKGLAQMCFFLGHEAAQAKSMSEQLGLSESNNSNEEANNG